MYKVKYSFTYIILFNPYKYYIKVTFPFYRLEICGIGFWWLSKILYYVVPEPKYESAS